MSRCDVLRGLMAWACLMAATPVTGSTFFAAVGGNEAPAGDAGRFLQVNPTTGAGTLIGNPGFGAIAGLSLSPGGQLFAVTGGSANPSNLITINAATGAGTLIGALPDAMDGLAFAPNGTLFANRFNGAASVGELWTIDPATAAAVEIGDITGCTGNNHVPGLDFSPAGILFGSRGGSSGHVENLVTLNTATAVCTPIVGSANPSNRIASIAFDPETGILYGVTGGTGSRLLTIDPVTGVQSTVGPIGFDFVASLEIIPSVPALPRGGLVVLGVLLAGGAMMLLRSLASSPS